MKSLVETSVAKKLARRAGLVDHPVITIALVAAAAAQQQYFAPWNVQHVGHLMEVQTFGVPSAIGMHD